MVAPGVPSHDAGPGLQHPGTHGLEHVLVVVAPSKGPPGAGPSHLRDEYLLAVFRVLRALRQRWQRARTALHPRPGLPGRLGAVDPAPTASLPGGMGIVLGRGP